MSSIKAYNISLNKYKTNKILVKLCGLRTRHDIDICSNADYLGFIVDVPSSKRSLNMLEAQRLINIAKEYSKTVAVTKSLESAKKIAKIINPDVIQLHFLLPSSPEEILLALDGQKYALCLGVATKKTLNGNHLYNEIGQKAEYVLVESAQGNEIIGGKGKTSDWRVTSKIIQSNPTKRFFVAGGINSENFSRILAETHASGIDIASGIENKIGEKSKKLTDKLFRNIREYEKSFNG